MRGRRTILIIIVIIGVVILSALAVIYLLQQNDETIDVSPVSENETSAPAVTPGPGDSGAPEAQVEVTLPPDSEDSELVEVVVSLQTMPRGFQLDSTELVTRELRLASEVGPDVLTDTDAVLGLFARRDIFQGETLTRDALVADPTLIGEETYGPSSLIPFNWVASAVPLDRLSSVGYALQPGDSVDVMLTLVFAEIDPELETLLPNRATFLYVTEGGGDTGDGGDGTGNGGGTTLTEVVIDPFGRFEELPTGELAHIAPSEPPRPIPVSFVIQNARVIQVGPWMPPTPPQLPTPTPDPDAGEEAGQQPQVTPTPLPPDVVVLALPPQQQLLLKYAVEREADIDFALRRAGDGQLFGIENVSTEYFINRFNVDIPPQFNYTAGGQRLIVVIEEDPTATGGSPGDDQGVGPGAEPGSGE